MEFWGVEIKSGQVLDVNIGEGKVLHISQACLGENNKGTKETVWLRMTVGDKKFVLGTLHPERLPHQLFEMVFDKDFQISHSWKNGSVYVYGYKDKRAGDGHEDSEELDCEDQEEDSEDEEEDLEHPIAKGLASLDLQERVSQ